MISLAGTFVNDNYDCIAPNPLFGGIVVGKVNVADVAWITATLFKKHELNWLVTINWSVMLIEKDDQIYFGGLINNVAAHESNNNNIIINESNVDLVSVNSTSADLPNVPSPSS
jgi:hypothetical protein